MGTSQAEYPAMEELQKLSIGDLVAIYDSKEEAEQHIRQQVFSNMQSDIAKRYHALSPTNKRIVGKLITYFTEKEHQGFNLAVVLHWVENGLNNDKVEEIALAAHIIDASGEDEVCEAYDGMDPQELSDHINAIKHRISFRGEHLARKGKKEKRKGSLNLIHALSNCLLFSPELIIKGSGIIEWVKEETLKEYNERPDFYTLARNEDGTLLVSVRDELYSFADDLDVEKSDIIDIKYGVINYTYGYRFLEESNDKGKKELVDDLIEELYSQQKKYEDDLRTQQEKHDTELQQLYASILETGIRKGDFGAIAKLDDALKRQ